MLESGFSSSPFDQQRRSNTADSAFSLFARQMWALFGSGDGMLRRA
jgi:hypothetical protein